MPSVTVQLPEYNEGQIVSRLLSAVTELDNPSARLAIRVLVDSDDRTSHLIAKDYMKMQGVRLSLCQYREVSLTGL